MEQVDTLESESISKQVVEQTWLSQRPQESAFFITAFFTFLLALISYLYWINFYDLQKIIAAYPKAVFNDHEWFRAWTTIFIHADQKHLLSNAFLFFILGSFLSSYFGWLSFPIMAFFFGGITNLIVLQAMPMNSTLVGASGIVFWLGGVWLTLYFLIDIKRLYHQRILRAIGVALLLFFPAETFDPSISYKAHFVGFSLGVLYGLAYYLFMRKKIIASIKFKIVSE